MTWEYLVRISPGVSKASIRYGRPHYLPVPPTALYRTHTPFQEPSGPRATGTSVRVPQPQSRSAESTTTISRYSAVHARGKTFWKYFMG